MKKVGITAAQCALGFRAAMIMNKIGVMEDHDPSFYGLENLRLH
jgi:hypothetical protein